MMNDIPLLTIEEAGCASAADLETAIDLILRQGLDCNEAGLVGPHALDMQINAPHLHIARLNAKTRSGRRFYVEDEWLSLPDPSAMPEIRVGLEWIPAPVCDGSRIHCGRPSLRLLAPGEFGQDGELTLARTVGQTFVASPVPSDRLDSCAANQEWADAVAERSLQAEKLLAAFVNRLQRSGTPHLSWSFLLQPLFSTLGCARRRSGALNPEVFFDQCRAWLESLADVPFRAELLHDSHLAELFRKVAFAPPAIDVSRFHDRFQALLNETDHSLAAICALLRIAGVGIDRLPEYLYYGGRLYRRTASVAWQEERRTATKIAYRLSSETGACRTDLAVLWQSSTPLVLGDVRFLPRSSDEASLRHEETYLGGLDAGVDFHWVSDTAIDNARLESPAELKLLDLAAYRPVVESP
jgi:hypothetical protein